MFKQVFRVILGFSFIAPVVLMTLALALFTGREKAARITGALVTRASAWILSLIVPSVASPDEFDGFRERIKRNYRALGAVYDTRVIEDSGTRLKFNVLNCPFTSALKVMGCGDLCRFACAGDWLVAARNKANWEFARTHSLGTDGQPCDHTYTRRELTNG